MDVLKKRYNKKYIHDFKHDHAINSAQLKIITKYKNDTATYQTQGKISDAKELYYHQKLHINISDKASMIRFVNSYLDGLQWCMYYYVKMHQTGDGI